MAEDSVKNLSQPGRLIILVVFDSERRYPIPTGTIQQWQKYVQVGKFCNF